MEFKIGEKVILTSSVNTKNDDGIVWDDRFNKFIGKTGVIVYSHLSDTEDYDYIYYVYFKHVPYYESVKLSVYSENIKSTRSLKIKRILKSND